MKLKCVDCGVSSQEVSERTVYKTAYDYDNLNLCPACYAKRKGEEPEENDEEALAEMRDLGCHGDHEVTD